MKKDNKILNIRNSTAEFLIFTSQAGKDSIEVRLEDENVWLTQKLIAKLFDVKIPTINEHLKNIYSTQELNKKATIRNFLIVQKEGNREVSRNMEHYNLEVIIALGYRINSEKATNFRRWAIQVLKDYVIHGYILDEVRLKNGSFLSKKFFATVQNELHYATHGNTAAELITKRADHKKDHMGLMTWKKAPSGRILKSDVSIAKNYLDKQEIKALNRIVTMYLDYAEDQAEKGIPMTMKDWATKLNAFLQFNDKSILENAGKIDADIAKQFAKSEFEKYRPIQDKLFESDFDREVKKYLKKNKLN